LEGKYGTTHENSTVGGYHLIYYDIDFQVLENESGSKKFEDFEKTQSALHSMYLTHRREFFDKLAVSVGLRGSYFNVGKKSYLEPRLNLLYKLTPQIYCTASRF